MHREDKDEAEAGRRRPGGERILVRWELEGLLAELERRLVPEEGRSADNSPYVRGLPYVAGPAGVGTLDADAVRETFSGWHIFMAHGTWWAMRGGLQEWSGPASLLARVLRAGTLHAPAEKLSLQEYLDLLTPAELAEVYREGLPGRP